MIPDDACKRVKHIHSSIARSSPAPERKPLKNSNAPFFYSSMDTRLLFSPKKIDITVNSEMFISKENDFKHIIFNVLLSSLFPLLDSLAARIKYYT